MAGNHIKFSADGKSGAGYIALPESGTGPAVIVIQEWWGLVGHITDIVDRFAAAGFVALAPDLYHGQAASEPDQAKKLMMELELDRAGEEIVTAAKYLAAMKNTTSDRVGVVGFCMGGSLAIWSGTLSDQITATVGFYPGASWERHAPDWSRYSGKASIIHCAEGDGTSAAPGIQEALTEINGAGGDAVAYDYQGTGHAFFNDDRPEVFNESAAKLAWARTINFFAQKLPE
jgi:carboxymethylenebutenolidase